MDSPAQAAVLLPAWRGVIDSNDRNGHKDRDGEAAKPGDIAAKFREPIVGAALAFGGDQRLTERADAAMLEIRARHHAHA